MSILAVQFFSLQVLRSSRYELRSENNRLRRVTLPPPRGTLYDRDGEVVAENVPGYTVSVLPGRRDSVAHSLERLSPYLGLNEESRGTLLEELSRRPNQALVVREQADFTAVSAIEERRPGFPRVSVEMRPRRRYPRGRQVAHVLGYVGEISGQQLEQPEFRGYRAGRVVGKAGVERQYESRLGGAPGVRYMEVNAVGSVVREFGPRPRVPPVPGENLVVGLDMDLQMAADSLFPADHRGAVVALEPSSGEVLLYYSHPTYDPNRFIGGIDLEYWRSLQEDPDRPLLDRVSAATYPPGSTFKLAMATIAMERGMVSLDTRMPTACDGTYRYGNRTFRCWRPEGHGDLDLAGAIKESCNVYFYQLGEQMRVAPILEGARRLGFGRATGIDLPYEASGHIPASTEWYTRRYGRYGWTQSVALNLAIGQGENQQTLLREALFFSALATGERPIVPHLVVDPRLERRRVDWSLGLTETQREGLVSAMGRVVNEVRGTAYPHRLENWRLAGKTGTAQNPHGEPHSWFVGFAPMDDPQIVIAALVEHGHPDEATSLAVPYASQLVRTYLDSRVPPEGERLVRVPAE